ncbi:MAG: ribokinase, partial [Cryptosporangiaceae bacterium]|nr:ribokinase [Cryptosporangiaceae bacterium]
ALGDIVTPNEGEAAELLAIQGDTEAMGPEPLARLAGGGLVLITLGSRGAVLVGADGQERLPAPAVTVVDTTGAGDTLNGALAAGLAAGLSATEAARRAVVAASLAVTRAGAREGMPTTGELEAALTRAD